MKKTLSLWAAIAVAFCILEIRTVSADSAPANAPAATNKICPVSGKPADPHITVVYEGIAYAFADEASRAKFSQDRKNSLYEKLGGKAALDAVIDAFYVKVLADERIKHIFDDINMHRQIRKQKEFLAAAFGVRSRGPEKTCAKHTRASPDSMIPISMPWQRTCKRLSKNLK